MEGPRRLARAVDILWEGSVAVCLARVLVLSLQYAMCEHVAGTQRNQGVIRMVDRVSMEEVGGERGMRKRKAPKLGKCT